MQDRDTILGVITGRAEGIPYRILESKFSITTGTLGRIMKKFAQLGKSSAELTELPEEDLIELFYPGISKFSKGISVPDFESMCRRMEEKGSRLNMSALWWEYQNESDGPFYGYTQFTKHFKEYVEKTRGPQHLKMLIERIPGERMFIDWVGDQPRLLLNEKTGELEKVHIFGATLGVSSLGYAEVFPDEKLPSFIQGVVHALTYYGGAPRFIVPDNLKTAVTKNTRDQLILTSACRDLQEYYGVVFLPPPPLKPTGKATVERWVRFTETHYVEPLKKQAAETPFTSVAQINEAGRLIVDNLNNRIERGRKCSRRDIFQDVDQAHLHPLPEAPFVCWQTFWAGKIPTTYHITFEGHFYSVPYTCAGKYAILKASTNEVVITDKANQFLARHPRAYSDFPKKITNPVHLHPDHQFYALVNAMDGSRYRKWAQDIGENTTHLVEAILASADHEEQMYEKLTRVICRIEEADAQTVESAARWCIANRACQCSQFTRAVLRRMQDHGCGADDTGCTTHENVRGKDYYE